MNTHLPLPERTLPPESAERIRAAIIFEDLDRRERRANRWMLGLVAALVVVALLAVAAVLWPATPEPRIAERPSASPTPATAEPTAKSTTTPSPVPRPSNSVPLEPGPKQEPFETDRGALTTSKARALISECNAPEKVDVQKVPYARRATDGQQTLDVVIYRLASGQEWLCAPASQHVPLDEFNPDNGPNADFPVVTDSGWSETVDRNGLTVEWSYRARPEIERIQVRAVVEDQPTAWFEAKVKGGFAFLPIFTPGTFDQPAPDEQMRLTLEYQHRAFDKDGREVPVRVMELPG